MGTPVKSNRAGTGAGAAAGGGGGGREGRPSFVSRVRQVGRSLSRSRRKTKKAQGGSSGGGGHAGADADADANAGGDAASLSSSSSGSIASYGRSLRRSLSRGPASRSSSASALLSDMNEENQRPLLVAVTSCRSDAYYNQKAPGSTSKLPRKAPHVLKLFHELAVGLKDAYEAVGATPTNPAEGADGAGAGAGGDSPATREGRQVLWDFMGNLDLLLALVDEVATDTVTRRALKDDTAFKSLRDVIKKCNKILETMLVRRERKYTLFLHLPQPHDAREVKKIKSWNSKVEMAINHVSETPASDEAETSATSESDEDSVTANSIAGITGTGSTSSGIASRGRSLLPTAGIRARRATPTPRLRDRLRSKSADSKKSGGGSAADDGFASTTSPVTPDNLAKLQSSLSDGDRSSTPLPVGMNVVPGVQAPLQDNAALQAQEVKPKDELVDVIRGLKAEKEQRKKGGIAGSMPSDLKPNWLPKADIPSAVPKLPTEYIHRHRLMKTVVNCLLDRGAGPRDTDDVDNLTEPIITTITSRHSDKAGNGKTTLAAATIQTVEVRERFPDGIAWIQLGRAPLTEKDIRRLYEELHDQLLMQDAEIRDDNVNDDDHSFGTSVTGGKSTASTRVSSLGSTRNSSERDNFSIDKSLVATQLAKSRRRFQGGELEGIKEDLGRILTKRKVLLCLDDVWRVEDAKWFIFDPKHGASVEGKERAEASSDFRVLVTTRIPSLLSPSIAQEVFVRIFSEHEAVKLLLFAAGRRMYGSKNSPVFQQARVIVKGCGNSPLAVRVAGGMLRSSNRNWTLSSSAWTALLQQCKASLEEASKIRSFTNSVGRIVDLSFMTVNDLAVRTVLRRCFVAFAMAYSDNEWVKIGKGIPKSVVVRLFEAVGDAIDNGAEKVPPDRLLNMLETMNLLERARHGVKSRSSLSGEGHESDKDAEVATEDEEVTSLPATTAAETPCYVMHESIMVLAEDMATRPSSSFIPSGDEYTSFGAAIDAEVKSQDGLGPFWSAPWRGAAKYVSKLMLGGKVGMEEYQFHRLVISSLIGVSSTKARIPSVAFALKDSKSSLESIPGGDEAEMYIAAHMPNHLIRAKMLCGAGELLSDADYTARRVAALGTVEATRRQVLDLVELRREVSKVASERANSKSVAISEEEGEMTKADTKRHPTSLDGHTPPGSPIISPVPVNPSYADDAAENSPDAVQTIFVEDNDVDIGAVQRDASRRIIDEVYRVVDLSRNSVDSLNMAMCLSTIGEGLIRSRQPREAMLRLEEAVGIYRGVLGQYHIDVARALNSVAKALVRLGESRVALLKFAEASKIFEACNATRHYDSIANAQSMANLLVDVKDWSKAEAKFDDVIAIRKAVYGNDSLQAAKATNDHAVVLAKHARMGEALQRYEEAKRIYEALLGQELTMTLASQLESRDAASKRGFDLALINLNIASIKSKKGDPSGAIMSYEKGVKGLKEYLEEHANGEEDDGSENARVLSTKRHLVSAMGRIGSLKLKSGDHKGALEAYLALLEAVEDGAPLASRMEKAKAQVKCATIYRQRDTSKDSKLAIYHLRKALAMYSDLHGRGHKDTKAIETSLRQWESQQNETGGAI